MEFTSPPASGKKLPLSLVTYGLGTLLGWWVPSWSKALLLPPAEINVLNGRGRRGGSCTAFITFCSNFLSAVEQLLYKVVIKKVIVLSTTHLLPVLRQGCLTVRFKVTGNHAGGVNVPRPTDTEVKFPTPVCRSSWKPDIGVSTFVFMRAKHFITIRVSRKAPQSVRVRCWKYSSTLLWSFCQVLSLNIELCWKVM